MTVKPISGQPSSAEVRAQLAKEGKPVLLAFTRGLCWNCG